MYTTNLRGEQGGIFIEDTSAHTPAESGNTSWVQGKAITDCVIAAITMNRWEDESNLVGKTVEAGQFIDGTIQSITLTSGCMQLFNFTNPDKVSS